MSLRLIGRPRLVDDDSGDKDAKDGNGGELRLRSIDEDGEWLRLIGPRLVVDDADKVSKIRLIVGASLRSIAGVSSSWAIWRPQQ